MKFSTDIFIEAAATWFPGRRQSTSSVVSAGLLDPAEAAMTGVVAVPVSDIAAPEMAVLAAHRALEQANRDAREIDLLMHAWLYYQGHDLWSPPHYIANQIGATNCLPIGIHQGCDGGALALQQAALRLSAVADENVALITSADRFNSPGIDRWNCLQGLALGDCGAAVVLSTQQGDAPFLLESISTRTVVELELLNRGSAPFNDYPLAAGKPMDQRPMADEAIAKLGEDYFYDTASTQIRGVLLDALTDAGISDIEQELDLIVFPRVGNPDLEFRYNPACENIPVKQIRLNSMTGHLGTSDWAADLADLNEREMLKPGKCAAIFVAGGGYTWVCVVVRACS